MGSPALFLDRDGTLIPDVGYLSDPEKVALLPDVVTALTDAKARGYKLVIVSNQSGIARGYFDEATAHRVQARVNDMFEARGVTFDGVYFCVHGPDDGCACRKPSPGMLLDAARDLDIDLSRSIMIGDKPSDIEAGRHAGCRAYVAFETPVATATIVAKTWKDIQRWLGDQK